MNLARPASDSRFRRLAVPALIAAVLAAFLFHGALLLELSAKVETVGQRADKLAAEVDQLRYDNDRIHFANEAMRVRAESAEQLAAGLAKEAEVMRQRWVETAARDYDARSRLNSIYFRYFETGPLPRLVAD